MFLRPSCEMSLRLSARMLSGLTTRCNTAPCLTAVCASSLMFETEKLSA
nr:MAG TPA: hypothetical protein [Caudoviricetes sp.]